jgi:uncharacterized protein YkwD
MIRSVISSLILVATLAPAGIAVADPVDINKPASALSTATRIGNRVSVGPAPAPSGIDASSEMQALVELVNLERLLRGIAPLRLSSQLQAAALDHTRNQAADGRIYHVDPDDGSNAGRRISRTGYVFSAWGENLAADARSAQDALKGWMANRSHCRNILNPAFTEIGVGLVVEGTASRHFWTQNFGRAAGDPSPIGTYNDAWC